MTYFCVTDDDIADDDDESIPEEKAPLIEHKFPTMPAIKVLQCFSGAPDGLDSQPGSAQGLTRRASLSDMPQADVHRCDKASEMALSGALCSVSACLQRLQCVASNGLLWHPPRRPWQTWGGRLTDTDDLNSMLPSCILERRRTVGLPPETPPMPLPTRAIYMTDSGIDLNVDYKKEIEPNLGRLIGRGGFGRVYECNWRGRKVAVKLLDTLDSDAELKSVMKVRCNVWVRCMAAMHGSRDSRYIIHMQIRNRYGTDTEQRVNQAPGEGARLTPPFRPASRSRLR